MATGGCRGDRKEEGGGGEGEERGRDGGGDQWLTCGDCGHRHCIPCENCNKPLGNANVSIGQVGHVKFIDHQTKVYRCNGHFTDLSRGEGKPPTCALKWSSGGNLSVEKLKKLTIPQHQTVIVVGSEREAAQEVKVNVVDDREDVEDAQDGIFMLKSEWPHAATSRTNPAEKTEVLLTQMMQEGSDDLFLKVLEEILKAELPAKVIRRLYDKFRLRLLGLTKSLQLLMEVEASRVSQVLRPSMQAEVKRELSLLVPEERRPQVTWREFSHIPVQCSEDAGSVEEGGEGASSSSLLLPSEVEEDRVQTVRGALDLAVQYGNYETCKSLLDQGHHCDLKALNPAGLTPFHIACRYGQSHLLDLLVEKGAAIHEPDSRGWSPLHHAFSPEMGGEEEEGKRLTTVRWLMAHGADVNVLNKDGQTALDLAKMGGYNSALQILVTDRLRSPSP